MYNHIYIVGLESWEGLQSEVWTWLYCPSLVSRLGIRCSPVESSPFLYKSLLRPAWREQRLDILCVQLLQRLQMLDACLCFPPTNFFLISSGFTTTSLVDVQPVLHPGDCRVDDGAICRSEIEVWADFNRGTSDNVVDWAAFLLPPNFLSKRVVHLITDQVGKEALVTDLTYPANIFQVSLY